MLSFWWDCRDKKTLSYQSACHLPINPLKRGTQCRPFSLGPEIRKTMLVFCSWKTSQVNMMLSQSTWACDYESTSGDPITQHQYLPSNMSRYDMKLLWVPSCKHEGDYDYSLALEATMLFAHCCKHKFESCSSKLIVINKSLNIGKFQLALSSWG